MNLNSLFNENWYRIKELKPSLAPDVSVSRHVYRLKPHYVLHRASTRSWHRMSATAYEFVARFDGRLKVQELWAACLAQQGEQAPSQGDVIALLARLHEADLLIVDARLATDQLLGRRDRMRQQDSRNRLWNPLYLRVGLMDPDRLVTYLDRQFPRGCFKPLAFSMLALWLLALFCLVPQWSALASYLATNNVFDPARLLLMAAAYSVMKILHELAHALVVKRYGGDVRECGLALLVLIPNPYVDASAANAFSNKYHRMLVSSAGILVEITLAAMAALVWINSSGLVQSTALSVMLIGTTSTLLFNGNPLLKFDGYYILSDWLEIPNLASRSRRYLLGGLAGLAGFYDSSNITLTDKRERLWLIGYGVLSSVYRILLMIVIAWIVSAQYFFFGTALAIYICVMSGVVPACKAIAYVGRQPATARSRALIVGGTSLFLLAGVAIAVPLPRVTVANGVVWLPEGAVLRIEQDCEVAKLYVQSGSNVEAGTRLFDCVDAHWQTEVAVAQAEMNQLDAERAGLLLEDPVEHQRLVNQRETVQSRYKLARQRLDGMHVVARNAGQFLTKEYATLEGRFLPANSVAGYVVPGNQRTIRVALTEADIGGMDLSQPDVTILLPTLPAAEQVSVSQIARQTPKASRRAAAPALTTLGGGKLPATSIDGEVMLDQPVFDIELSLRAAGGAHLIGSRVKVRFEQEANTLARRFTEFAMRSLPSRDGV